MPRLMADAPFLHPECEINDVTFGRYTEVGRGSRLAHSHLGDYSYCDRYADIANATVGKFSNIAAFVRIGATDHPMEKASLHHFHYRSASYFEDAADDEAWFDHRRSRRAVIGHDTWLGHGHPCRAVACALRARYSRAADGACVVGLAACATAHRSG